MAKGFKHGAGGGASLNFKVVGGTTEPVSPKENTIWVNTDQKITSWHFGAEEPNVYNIETISSDDIYRLRAPHTLKAGEIISFVIPETVTVGLDYVRFHDGGADDYCVRNAGGSSIAEWSVGTKVTVKISNELCTMGEYQCRTALIYGWGSYYHEEGTVWIQTGTSSTAEFNALKNDGITVYPLSAKQYIDGVWVSKIAKTYQNGAWVDWILNLYNNGDECISVTGGWSVAGVTLTTQDSLVPAAMNSDHMLIGQTTAASKNTYCVMSTAEKINIVPSTKTLFVDYTTLKTSGGNVSNIYIQQDKTIGSNNYIAMSRLTAAEGKRATLEVDVSSVNGEYFVIFASWYSTTEIRAAKIHRVWLE